MMGRMITVTICLYNGARYITRALESVFAQSFQDFEVVVIDDGSTDGGAELVATQFADARLRLIRQHNQGLGAARNAALAAARGTFVAFLDQDDEWRRDKLQQQIELLERRPDVGLVFTDCAYIDEEGRAIGLASEHFGHASIDFAGDKGVRALLTRGCFIDISSVVVPRSVLGDVGGFRSHLRYVEDYDLWLRIARLYGLALIREPLTRRRLHADQFTRRHHAIALAEESALLRPLLRNRTYPVEVKRIIRRYLFGQHRDRFRGLVREGRPIAGAYALVGAVRYPEPLLRSLVSLCGTVFPPLRRIKRRLWAILHDSPTGRSAPIEHDSPSVAEIWVDGSPLDASPTGFFNVTVEIVRALVRHPRCQVRVEGASAPGLARLQQRLGSQIFAMLQRSSMRARPRGSVAAFEVLIWRRHFRIRGATHIAFVMDLTTRLRPDLHTNGNILDFERYVRYVLRHADTVATISQHSKADILRMLPVFPESVCVLPVFINPVYLEPSYSRDAMCRHGIAGPFLLSVGTREPRKNLRRLVDAFASVMDHGPLGGHQLMLAGPPGWDDGFDDWLRAHPAAHRVSVIGFVPDVDLRSLYHFASVVVYPSLYEGFGLPVLEAMACSGMVLTSNISALPELLGPGGRYFDPSRDEDIARAILEAVSMPAQDAARYRDYCHQRSLQLRRRWAGQPILPGLPCAS